MMNFWEKEKFLEGAKFLKNNFFAKNYFLKILLPMPPLAARAYSPTLFVGTIVEFKELPFNRVK